MPENELKTRADIYVEMAGFGREVYNYIGDEKYERDVHDTYRYEVTLPPIASSEYMPLQAENSNFYQSFKNEFAASHKLLDEVSGADGTRFTDPASRLQLVRDAQVMDDSAFAGKYGDSFTRISENGTEIALDGFDFQQEIITHTMAISESDKLERLIASKAEEYNSFFSPEMELEEVFESAADAKMIALKQEMELAAINENLPLGRGAEPPVRMDTDGWGPGKRSVEELDTQFSGMNISSGPRPETGSQSDTRPSKKQFTGDGPAPELRGFDETRSNRNRNDSLGL